jgi:flagellar biosynthetic protein FliR
MLVFARIGGLLAAAPVLGTPIAPFQVRALLALAITLILLPTLGDQFPAGLPGPMYPVVLAIEVTVGLLMGFFLTLFLEAVRFTGDLIGRTAGFAAAETFNPDAGTTEGPMGHLFFITAALVFFLIDGHLHLIATLAESYQIVAVGAFTAGPALGAAVGVGLTEVFINALAIALPIEMGVLAITVAEGVIARAVPQINILHISFAVKIIVTLLLLSLALPAVVQFIAVLLAGMNNFVHELLMSLG